MDERSHQYRELVFATSRIQDVKLRVHALYSDIPIDIHANVANLVGLQGDEAVADIGCGTGDFLRYLRKDLGHRGPLYGLDFSTGVFRPASIANLEQGTNINYLACMAEDLCLASASIDIASMQHMLGFVPQIDKACQEAIRILRHDGTCVFTANAMKNYPHVRKYRNWACELLGWPRIEVNTERFCAENMDDVLRRNFTQVSTLLLEGSLRVPVDEFIAWFSVMIDNWHPLPSGTERALILQHLSNEWVVQDVDPQGFLNEPKWVAMAKCVP